MEKYHFSLLSLINIPLYISKLAYFVYIRHKNAPKRSKAIENNESFSFLHIHFKILQLIFQSVLRQLLLYCTVCVV